MQLEIRHKTPSTHFRINSSWAVWSTFEKSVSRSILTMTHQLTLSRTVKLNHGSPHLTRVEEVQEGLSHLAEVSAVMVVDSMIRVVARAVVLVASSTLLMFVSPVVCPVCW
jgi:hypothetical protein